MLEFHTFKDLYREERYMLGIFRRKKTEKTSEKIECEKSTIVDESFIEISPLTPNQVDSVAKREEIFPLEEALNIKSEGVEKKKSFFERLKEGLQKTRQNLGDGLSNLLLGKKKIDDELLEEIENYLLLADVGVEATNKISSALAKAVSRNELTEGDALMAALKKQLLELLIPLEQPLFSHVSKTKPQVILMVGVNGAGKTTTIGKLAKQLTLEGKKVMLAAGDTFRAAAVEQLQVWGERNDIPVIAQQDRKSVV